MAVTRTPRLAAVLLAALLPAAALAGCGGRTDGGTPVPSGDSTTTVAPGMPG